MNDARDLTAGDPLAAIREQLVAAARRRRVHRRRRRRGVTLAAVALLLLAAGAGASELAGLSTGVPAVDKLLDVENGSGGSEGSARPDIRPGTGGASDPLPAPRLAGGPGGTAVAYVSRDGFICSAFADDRHRSENDVRGGTGGCLDPAGLRRRLERRGAVLGAFAVGADGQEISGHAAADVTEIRAIGPYGTGTARLTDPWTPRVPGGRPQRFFIAYVPAEIDVGDDGVQPGEIDELTRSPLLEVHFADGSVKRTDGSPY